MERPAIFCYNRSHGAENAPEGKSGGQSSFCRLAKRSASEYRERIFEYRRSAERKQMKKQTVKLNGTAVGEGRPKICVPITGKNRQEILAQGMEAAASKPDLAEWRADFWEEIGDGEKAGQALESLAEILGAIPILFTFRSQEEGGNRKISPEDYLNLNLWAAGRREIHLVDVEIMNPQWEGAEIVRQIHAAGKPVIGSRHYFERTPGGEELKEAFELLAGSGADILKLAVMPRTPQDVLRLMEATMEEHEKRPQPVVTMSMGARGVISRLSGGLTGSAITFGAAAEASAPGQLPAGKLREILEFLEAFQA